VPGEQQHVARMAGEVVNRLGAGLEIDQGRDRLAVAAPARQLRDRRRVDPADPARFGAEDEQVVDAAARERAVQPVAGLEREAGLARSRGPSARGPSPSG
jgi:hypothetical protein